MKPYLLDVNLLLALAWPSHVHHAQSQDWFSRTRKAGFRTCPLTQTAFVRISCNPRFTPNAVTPQEAVGLLERITSLHEHTFWPDDLPLRDAIPRHLPVVGHRQITDAYLLALATAGGAVLATLDRGVLALTGPDGANIEWVHDE